MRWALIALGGCTFSTAISDRPPSDTPLIDAPVDVAIDGSPTVDTDGDGVFDATDNCPVVSNPNQHDEDGDNAGDVCDRCPQVAGGNADADGDMIGDACDPHPNATGDVLVRFEPFLGTALPAGWTIAAGTAANFVVANDTLTINAGGGTQIMILDTTSQDHAIDVGVRLPADTTNTTFFTALTDVKSDLADFFGCGLRLDTQIREFISYNDPNFSTIATDPMPADAPMFPGTFRIVSVLDTTQTCTIPKGAQTHEMTATANTRNRTNVGVRVGDVTAEVRYVAVYRF